jgi:hypothetical protein
MLWTDTEVQLHSTGIGLSGVQGTGYGYGYGDGYRKLGKSEYGYECHRLSKRVSGKGCSHWEQPSRMGLDSLVSFFLRYGSRVSIKKKNCVSKRYVGKETTGKK